MLIVVALVILVGGILLLRAGMKIIGALVSVVGFVLVAGLVLLAVVGKAYRVPSESMVPTVDVGDRVVAVDVGDPKLEDIVVLHPPAGAEESRCGERTPPGELCAKNAPERSDVTFIKRVVARGGDTVALRRGLVVRNGKPVKEPYARSCRGEACDFPRAITVPRGQFYVLGDNRGESDDSRFWGPVPAAWVTGRVIGRYWPLKDFGKL